MSSSAFPKAIACFTFMTIFFSSFSCSRDIFIQNTYTNTNPSLQYQTVEDPFLTDFENYVAHLPIINFEGDALLLQLPDYLNGRTTYRHLDVSSLNEYVYQTDLVDSNQEVVILNSDQDGIPTYDGRWKRIYVVLRRALLVDRSTYYVNYVYLRDAPEGQTRVHNFGGRKVLVEWDFWDHRETSDAKAQVLENAFRCSNTIFIPCASNETIDLPIPTKPGNPKRGNNPTHHKPPPSLSIKNPIQLPEGLKVDEFMEFYSDLEVPRLQEGRGVLISDKTLSGLGVGLFMNPLTAIPLIFAIKVDGAVTYMKDRIVEGGMGLVKSFQGMFGGLGTEEADPGAVEIELGIEGGDNIEELNEENENAELEAEVMLPSAGGLGGFFSNETTAPEGDNSTDKGRSAGKQYMTSLEPPYVQFGWTRPNEVFEITSSNDPFVGFGACRYHKVRVEDLEETVMEDQLIRVFQTALKTQCLNYETEFVQAILRAGLLETRLDKTFEIVTNSPHFKYEKLNVKQLKELHRGFELYTFSKIYAQELRSPTPSPSSPGGSVVSRSVFTLGQSLLYSMRVAQEGKFPINQVFKMIRNFIKTATIAYSKLVEDRELIQEEDDNGVLEVNNNNRVYLLNIIQYFKTVATHVLFDSSINPLKSFEEFYELNTQVLDDTVNPQQWSF